MTVTGFVLKSTAEGGRAEERQNDWVWLSFGRVRLWDKQSAHKEWVRRQFRNPCFTGLICSGYLQPRTYQLVLVCRIEPEIAVVSFGCSGISIYVGSLRPRFHVYFHGFPTSEQLSGVMNRQDAYGSDSACAASRIPITFRAYSSTRCCEPPQVPRKGITCSRAHWIPSSAPSRLL